MKKLFAVLLALTLVLSMGTIALAADEVTGTITISNAVNGATYDIYKMFDFTPIEGSASNGRYSYASDAWKTFVEGDASAYLAFDEDTGTIKWNGATSKDDAGNDIADPVAVAALAKAAVAYAKANSIAPTASKTAPADGTVEFTDVALGYYAIDTSLGNICALTNVDNTFVAHEKNQKPDIEKKIIENGQEVDANNVAIGDTVTYKTTVTVGKGQTDYIVHDTMSEGLTFVDANNDGKIDVTVTASDGSTPVYTVTTPGADDGCTFEVAFDNDYIAGLKDVIEIEIVYEATLNENAVVGSTGNPNTVVLEYKNENDVENTDEDIVITYTTKLVVDKVDGEGNPLAGAGFTLYKEDAEGNWAPIGDEQLITALTAGEEAIYTWNGLEEGDYKLVETTTPDGYNTAKDIEFTITCDEPETVVTVADTANWDETVSEQVAESADDEGNGLDIFEATVVNKTGSLLPETGGIGTTIFYIVGSVLMLAALVILVSKKRMASFA